MTASASQAPATWADKIRIAKEAHEAGRRLRQGKRVSFYPYRPPDAPSAPGGER